MQKERLPREIDYHEKTKKINKIKKLVSKKKFSKLLDLENSFEIHKKNFHYDNMDNWFIRFR